ncbi:unnamed protein product [Tetraodon nigroviridis]|uniref:TRAF3-interacting protein 1 n=1 Tax=Tetraodon nigroviridis TaxID=99883 RepID=Q4SK34_TETNG|nr:unnamed protein product [Tetraodon nigroviridis]
MNAAVVKKTQETLGKVIKKPVLTEKLLNRPPFRFLRDIFVEEASQSQNLPGQWDLIGDFRFSLQDKDAKMAFLQKAIDVVMLVSGEPLAVKPVRVVCGHEPERTNELLQALAKCCLAKLSSDEAVRRVVSGEKTELKTKASTSRSQDKENREGREANLDKEANLPEKPLKKVPPEELSKTTKSVPAPAEAAEVQMSLTVREYSEQDINGGEQHGALVKKILDTKKDYETSSSSKLKQSIESEVALKKEQDTAKRETERVCSSIQTMCRSTQFLAKNLDYVQENIDAMQAELIFWCQESKKYMQACEEEERTTEKALEPRHTELLDLEQQIVDMWSKIRTSRANILRNEEKREKLLRGISFHHGA